MKAAAVLMATLMGIGPTAAGPTLLTATPADPDGFAETYDDTPPVSGSALVGLSLGAFGDAVDVADVRIVAPRPPATSLCVRVTTLDGRFSANNPYLVPPGEADGIRLSTVTRKFDREVAGYPPETFAIRSYVASDGCNPRSAVHLPQLQPTGGTGQLTVQVNSNTRRTTVVLNGPGGAVYQGVCEVAKAGAMIAFDKLCRVERPIGAPAGLHRLEMGLDDGFGVETMSVGIYLPAAL